MTAKFQGVTIFISVADVERTQAFYSRHLGIDFIRNEEEDGSAWLMATLAPATELIVFPGEPRPGNTPILVFGLPDGGIDAMVESLAADGIEIVTPVSHAPGGWSAEFLDPDGQVLSFYQAENQPR